MRISILAVCLLAGCSASGTLVAPESPLFSRPAPVASVPWNLDRIDQAQSKLDGVYNCSASCGAGVHVYLIDGGIRSSHHDFAGRIGNGADFVGDGNGTEDCQGHGTAMAGLAAGTVYGVAKRATIHPLRVVDCQGMIASHVVYAAIDWIIANGQHPGVINLSVSGKREAEDDAAIAAANAAGFLIVIAAGNGVGQDACNTAGATGFTVGSTIHYTQGKGSDAIDVQSNVGPCVELFAPGMSIVSDWYTSDDATLYGNGTSHATAQASGAAALYLAEHPTADPATVAAYLVSTATVGALNNVPAGTVNRLLRVP